MAREIPGDRHPYRLPGLKVWVNNEGSAAYWVEAPGGWFLRACPECRNTYWYRPGDIIDPKQDCEHQNAAIKTRLL